MKPTIKSYGIVDAEKPHKTCRLLKEKGFSYLSLDMEMFLSPEYLEWKDSDDDKERKFDELSRHLIEACKETQLTPEVVLAPYLLTETKREDRNVLLKQFAKASIKVAGAAGIKYVVVQPLFAGLHKSALKAENEAFYLELAEMAQELRVQILIENQVYFREKRYIRGFLSDAASLIEFVEHLNEKAGFECFGVGLDVGAANLAALDMRAFVGEVSSYLKMVRLTENDGFHNANLFPFLYGWNRWQSYGVQWNLLIGALRAVDFDGILLLDITTELSNIPYVIRDSLLTLAFQTLSYFEWVIEIERKIKSYKHIVLFGAGNMCKQYMRCYGEAYPPLFTCDNNTSLWGTTVYGLEVKSPQELLRIPEDTGVFICNMYYKEIQQQLMEMGIQNIEFFNDEFLPVTYSEEE